MCIALLRSANKRCCAIHTCVGSFPYFAALKTLPRVILPLLLILFWQPFALICSCKTPA